MNFDLAPGQEAIRDAIRRVCSEFGDDHSLQHDREGGFPAELHDALARAGWPGIAMPEADGGSNLGITEASTMVLALVAHTPTPPKRDPSDC